MQNSKRPQLPNLHYSKKILEQTENTAVNKIVCIIQFYIHEIFTYPIIKFLEIYFLKT